MKIQKNPVQGKFNHVILFSTIFLSFKYLFNPVFSQQTFFIIRIFLDTKELVKQEYDPIGNDTELINILAAMWCVRCETNQVGFLLIIFNYVHPKIYKILKKSIIFFYFFFVDWSCSVTMWSFYPLSNV